jgi:hypothetical protein
MPSFLLFPPVSSPIMMMAVATGVVVTGVVNIIQLAYGYQPKIWKLTKTDSSSIFTSAYKLQKSNPKSRVQGMQNS